MALPSVETAPSTEAWQQGDLMSQDDPWNRTEDLRDFRYLPAIRLNDVMTMVDSLPENTERAAIRQLEQEYSMVTALVLSINEKTGTASGAYSFFERQPGETAHAYFHPLSYRIQEQEHELKSKPTAAYHRGIEHVTGLLVEHVRTELRSVQPEIELIPAIALSGKNDTSPVTDAEYREAEQKFHRLMVDEKLGYPPAAYELNVYRAQAAFIEKYGAASVQSIRMRWDTQVTTEPHISMAVAEILQDPPDAAQEKIEVLLEILNIVLKQIPNIMKREDYPTEADWKRAISRKEDELSYFKRDFFVDISMTFTDSYLRDMYIQLFRTDLLHRYAQARLHPQESPIS